MNLGIINISKTKRIRKHPMIKQGSRWTSYDSKVFVVMSIVETDSHTWIHYRSEKPGVSGTPQEYSCYQESFESRFRPLPE
jgi:hypothetical protein